MSKDTPAGVQAFLDALPEARRGDFQALHALIRKAAPKLLPFVHDRFLGYGAFHYRYESGREGETFRVGLMNGKQAISLYVNVVDGDLYLPEKHVADFPKASIGRSCIRFKKAADLDPVALARLMKLASRGKGAGEQ